MADDAGFIFGAVGTASDIGRRTGSSGANDPAGCKECISAVLTGNVGLVMCPGTNPARKKGGRAVRSREEKELEERAGAFAGNSASRNAQMGTDTAIDSMQELLYKAGKISKVGFDQSKGNLFE